VEAVKAASRRTRADDARVTRRHKYAPAAAIINAIKFHPERCCAREFPRATPRQIASLILVPAIVRRFTETPWAACSLERGGGEGLSPRRGIVSGEETARPARSAAEFAKESWIANDGRATLVFARLLRNGAVSASISPNCSVHAPPAANNTRVATGREFTTCAG
jgi:hypothetical protein